VKAAVASDAFHIGLVFTAFGFGFRHGIDWDHLAAISDITSTQTSRRKGLVLSTFYAAGHALVVFALGVLAITVGQELPSSVDTVMERVVGATLVLLGIYVVWGLLRHGRDFRMRSRWMLVLGTAHRAVRRFSRRPTKGTETLTFEHDHEHDAHEPHHVDEHVDHSVVASNGPPTGARSGHHRHRHVHSHTGLLPDDPFTDYRKGTAFGIGMLHGVGAETPTQLVIFVTAAGVSGVAGGLVLLGGFTAGLLTSNTVVAMASSLGFTSASRRWWLYASISVVTAAFSLVVGGLLLSGNASSLPAIFGG
jgi:high-affinity nickel-transport protein